MVSNGTLFGNGTPGGKGDPDNPTPASNPELGFEEDCANGTLPDVSFIGSTSAADEHPPAIPAAGAQFLATKLEALAANEELWNSTVFVMNYDENDGFFDHVPPPVPDPDKYPEEYITLSSPAGTPGGGLPLGAGFRVPAFIVSPWTTGGQIFSSVSDHTSCLRLIEAVAAAGGLSGGPGHLPQRQPLAAGHLQQLHRRPAFRPGKPAPSSTQFTPAPRRPTWPPSRRPPSSRCRRAPARHSRCLGKHRAPGAVSGRGEGLFSLPPARRLVPSPLARCAGPVR